MSPVIRVGHQTQSCRRTPDYIFCSVRLAIRAVLLPALKLVSRLSQARERSSVPKLTSWLVDPEFLRNDLGANGWTGLQPEWISDVLKTR